MKKQNTIKVGEKLELGAGTVTVTIPTAIKLAGMRDKEKRLLILRGAWAAYTVTQRKTILKKWGLTPAKSDAATKAMLGREVTALPKTPILDKTEAALADKEAESTKRSVEKAKEGGMTFNVFKDMLIKALSQAAVRDAILDIVEEDLEIEHTLSADDLRPLIEAAVEGNEKKATKPAKKKTARGKIQRRGKK